MTHPAEQNAPILPEPETATVPAVSGLFGKMVDKTGTIFAIGFLGSMSVLIIEIVMRHVFDSPTLWAHETTTFLCGIGFVFGGLFCASRDKHIRVVIIYDIAGPKLRRFLDIAISLICAVASGFFAWAAWLMVGRAAFAPDGSVRLETSGSAWNPPFPSLLKIFLLIVMIALTVQFIILAINYMRGLGGKDATE
ncbi:TRAP transporter small permease [Thalassospira sp.]|uniref:TRAP transporter small permease subunit n=1 Tax=Thalassospira sp. TaxID=1912094 RepID=UPI000C4FEC5D|nr:TRAP transporter small permease [Thalassospira sp.]MBC06734.1 C4-dicarboxylate ABC transporter permease [Thalassospira sp.]|tara:strand:+ start:8844 stop:9425 length:582 start_codon:yes stop_codon:yes gene_type:complete